MGWCNPAWKPTRPGTFKGTLHDTSYITNRGESPVGSLKCLCSYRWNVANIFNMYLFRAKPTLTLTKPDSSFHNKFHYIIVTSIAPKRTAVIGSATTTKVLSMAGGGWEKPIWTIEYTPLKINMEPKNGGLEDDFFLFNWVIFGFHVSFQGFNGQIAMILSLEGWNFQTLGATTWSSEGDIHSY